MGSWMRKNKDENGLYHIEAADKLVEYVKKWIYSYRIFTTIEHPYDGSWGIKLRVLFNYFTIW